MAEIAFEDGRGISAVRKRYAAHDWSADPTNLLIVCPTGGGKTYLACAIGIAACHNGHRFTYARMDDLARRLVIAHQRLLNDLSDTALHQLRGIGPRPVPAHHQGRYHFPRAAVPTSRTTRTRYGYLPPGQYWQLRSS